MVVLSSKPAVSKNHRESYMWTVWYWCTRAPYHDNNYNQRLFKRTIFMTELFLNFSIILILPLTSIPDFFAIHLITKPLSIQLRVLYLISDAYVLVKHKGWQTHKECYCKRPKPCSRLNLLYYLYWKFCQYCNWQTYE